MQGIELEFHHVGVACECIDDEIGVWTNLGYNFEGDPFIDTEQGIKGRFLTGGGPRVELLENLKGSSTLVPWLKRHTKFYHMGYLAGDFDSAYAAIRSQQSIIVRASVRSVYFDSRIAFFLMPNGVVIEIIERKQNSGATG